MDQTCNHIKVENEYQLILNVDKDIEVYADKHRIDQVVINYVNNAVKYAPESKQIHLNVESLNDQIKVSVKNFGQGIAEENTPKLFDRYYRASHGGNEYSGLGLGLYISSEINKRHDGKIGAESVRDEGSTFWFILPKALQ